MSPNVTKLLEQAKRLTAEERREFRALLDERTQAAAPPGADQQLARVLLERGVISSIRPTPTEADLARFDAWKPVPIQGKPISQTIVEERR